MPHLLLLKALYRGALVSRPLSRSRQCFPDTAQLTSCRCRLRKLWSTRTLALTVGQDMMQMIHISAGRAPPQIRWL